MRSRFGQGRAGFASPTLLASFLHHHPGGDPSAVAAFLAACRVPGKGSAERPVHSQSCQRNNRYSPNDATTRATEETMTPQVWPAPGYGTFMP